MRELKNFVFNENGVCKNPNIHKFFDKKKDGILLVVETVFYNEKWYAGYEIDNLVGGVNAHGGSYVCGANRYRNGFCDERKAVQSALEEMLRMAELSCDSNKTSFLRMALFENKQLSLDL